MSNSIKIRIGTRESLLAKAQASQVKDLLLKKIQQKDISLEVSFHFFKTTGDRLKEKNLSKIGGKGLFTKELEDALLNNEIDIAVHSMKDVPVNHTKGLDIISILKRSDPRDAFISSKYKSIKDLPQGSVIGTSSTRRKALMLNLRPDLKIVNFRGNVTTRLNKIQNNEVDATILAVSGLKRIKKEHHISSIISTRTSLPSVAQGAIGIQARINDKEISKLVKIINDKLTAECITAERSFLTEMNGSCHTPIASYCTYYRGRLKLMSSIVSPDGKEIYKNIFYGKNKEAKDIGIKAALDMKENAQHIITLL
ncbi:hydroxymethylbilane synthase [Flavobacteriaceae bacterium]|nr:hydroxymethylbilane synthase [Flavobacteriaceae bacterium]